MIQTNINWQPQNLKDNLVKLIPLTELDFEKIFEVAADTLIWEQHPTNDKYKKEQKVLNYEYLVKKEDWNNNQI